MATVEIDEAELQNFRNVSGTMAALLGNPKTRRQVLSAVKTIKPEASIPELDAAEPVLGEVAELRKTMSEFIAEQKKQRETEAETRAKEALTAEWNAGRKALKDEGYSDEALTKIEKFMEEEGIRKHSTAAAAYSRLFPEPKALDHSARYISPILDPVARKDNTFLESMLKGDTDGIELDGMIQQTLREVRGQAA